MRWQGRLRGWRLWEELRTPPKREALTSLLMKREGSCTLGVHIAEVLGGDDEELSDEGGESHTIG